MSRACVWVLFSAIGVITPVVAGAQTAPAIERPWIVEGGAGHAEFADSPPVPHTFVGVSTRVYVTERLAIGPEFTWMRGPGQHRDTFLTGNVTWDLRGRTPGSRMNLVPYLLGGGGFMSQTTEVGTGTFSSTEGAFTAGGGLRIESSRGFYIAPELRVGAELHWRAGVMVGFRK